MTGQHNIWYFYSLHFFTSIERLRSSIAFGALFQLTNQCCKWDASAQIRGRSTRGYINVPPPTRPLYLSTRVTRWRCIALLVTILWRSENPIIPIYSKIIIFYFCKLKPSALNNILVLRIRKKLFYHILCSTLYTNVCVIFSIIEKLSKASSSWDEVLKFRAELDVRTQNLLYQS